MTSKHTARLHGLIAAALIAGVSGCNKTPETAASASVAATAEAQGTEAAPTDAAPVPASASATTTTTKGEIIWPDMPGASQSCLGVEGAIKDGAEVMLHACKLAKDAIFTRNGKGEIGIVGHPELCLGGNKSDSATLLTTCSDAGSAYKLTASNVASAPFEDNAGGCVAISDADTPDKKFPWSLGATACDDKAPRFYFGE